MIRVEHPICYNSMKIDLYDSSSVIKLVKEGIVSEDRALRWYNSFNRLIVKEFFKEDRDFLLNDVEGAQSRDKFLEWCKFDSER